MNIDLENVYENAQKEREQKALEDAEALRKQTEAEQEKIRQRQADLDHLGEIMGQAEAEKKQAEFEKNLAKEKAKLMEADAKANGVNSFNSPDVMDGYKSMLSDLGL